MLITKKDCIIFSCLLLLFIPNVNKYCIVGYLLTLCLALNTFDFNEIELFLIPFLNLFIGLIIISFSIFHISIGFENQLLYFVYAIPTLFSLFKLYNEKKEKNLQ